ncbi:FIP1 Polyadenylation factor I complex subunit FIP1 [Pyrenophora tritici-repentis]|uniref:FIP1, Polyadenylation factor I complex, subunit FIP1 n=1 Tax=Pyrenophora tritici-repentis TaxID=45151 RepID=A0A2W1EW81_9PLEO|nr:FIP1 Polyadenylation factor I complex subunit FIP1 [Pyrenophora tritici-repentis]KAF7579305.1 FIP1, Polyadenylation factor I complex, subunit FIP1 [Pyrenophora tritici-repentis]KAG9378232.1 FIP1 Polyadenylation factor I complex protein [Pyrenophora tritici-repentis]KAI1541787.1 FIP1 Polyadenylation factor I complex subunit FIP1 [Pyrenophora tritici-repentis]KAI1554507.1 FIP1 Polyadenylation factor I complex subunit FIP1 [Pyrenophora tritici-repentis]
MADESDDDLYGDETTTQEKKQIAKEEEASSGDEPMDEESGDEDDSDSDIDIIIEKAPAPAKPTAPQQTQQESKAIKIEAPPPSTTPSQQQVPTRTVPTSGGTVPQLSATALSGTAFPAQRTSTIDVNGNPIYPPQGKEILSIDIDANLAEEQKIWRRPGEDQSDYFNYGFDEFTWELYRQRQVNMANTLQGQKNDMAQMQAMMGGGPMPGMPAMGGGPQGNAGPGGAPPTGPGGGGGGGGGMGGPGGMNEQQMQMMMQEMMAQGMDPSQMDFASFMQMAGQGMGGFPERIFASLFNATTVPYMLLFFRPIRHIPISLA